MSHDPINSSLATWGVYQLTLFLQAFFAKQESGNYRWCSCDEGKTEIMIVDKTEVNYETIDSTPVISMAANNIVSGNKVIGFLKHEDFLTGDKTYFDTYDQTVTIDCLAENDSVAKRLADMVFSGLKYNQSYIMEQGFNKFNPQAVTDKQIIKGKAEASLVSRNVPVEISYSIEWTIKEDDPTPLAGVQVTFNTE